MKYISTYFVIAVAALVSFTGAVSGQETGCAQDDYDCKINVASKRIATNSNDTEAYYNRGLAYSAKHNYDLTIADMDRYIALKPEKPEYVADGYFLRGNSYRDKGSLDQAISDFTRAVSFNPKLTNGYMNRGLVYYRQHKTDLALADLNRAYQLDANNAEVYYNRGLIYDQGKMYDLAIADFDKYITLNPGNTPYLADGFAQRGVAYSHKGDYDHALKDLTTSIQLSPDKASSYRSRAEVYRKTGKTSQAAADEQKAAAIDKP